MWSWLGGLLEQAASWLVRLLAAPIAAQADKTGAARQSEADLAAAQKTAEAENQAAVDAPKTPAGVVKELDDGTF